MDHIPSESRKAASVIPQSESAAEQISSPAAETPPARSLQLYPEAEFLPLPQPLMIAGGWAALMTLGAAIAACWFIPYNIRITTPTLVRPQSELNDNLLKDGPNSGLPLPAEDQSQQIPALALRAWVPNASINQVQIGQPVQVRLASCPYPDFGVLEGTIVAVASDVVPAASGLTGANTSSFPPAGSYEVHISPQALSLNNQQGQPCNLRAGMSGRADILVGRETILRFLLRQARLISDL